MVAVLNVIGRPDAIRARHYHLRLDFLPAQHRLKLSLMSGHDLRIAVEPCEDKYIRPNSHRGICEFRQIISFKFLDITLHFCK